VVLPAFHIALPAFTAFGGLKGHPWTFAYWLLLAWASAALGEELQFRGFLFSRLERLFGGVRGATALAVVAQAVLFGLGHFYQGWGGVLATGALGLLFGGLFLLAPRNLVPGMVLHGLVDTVSLTALYLGVNPGAMR
jgi:membrane protease YdiL (CAAX protease family)